MKIKNTIKKYSVNDKKSPLILDGKKNSFVWNMRYDKQKVLMVDYVGSGLTGPKAHPGKYYVRLNVGESV